MPNTRNHRPPFDPRYDFVVTPPAGRAALAVGGRTLEAGARFDKASVTQRRLRQMYESRLIALAPGQALLARPPRLRVIGPARGAGVPAALPPPKKSASRRQLLRAS